VLGRIVAGSTAITVTLLVCAMILGLSARDMTRKTMPILAGLYASSRQIDDRVAPSRRGEIAMTAIQRVRALPGVAHATVGEPPPNGASHKLTLSTTDRAALALRADVYHVSEGYFEALSLSLKQGRAIDARDTRDSTGAVVIGQTLAAQLFASGNAIGQPLTYRDLDDSTHAVRRMTVVGVVGDGRVGGLVNRM
jgi:hypothetical protein